MASATKLPSAMALTRSIRPSLLGTRWAPMSRSSKAPVRAPTRPISADAASQAHTDPSATYNNLPKTMKDFQSIAQQRRKGLAGQQSTANAADVDVAAFEPFTPKPSVPTHPLTEFKEHTLDPSVTDMLPLLRAQSPHYISIHIHERPYLVTLGDSIRLPFIMHNTQPGDILRLNRASILGSRDYTLKSGAWSRTKEDAALGESPDSQLDRRAAVHLQSLRPRRRE